MISRRATLAAGATAAFGGIGAVAAHRAHLLDEGLRTVGVRPHPEPDPRDVRLLAQAADAARALLGAADAALAAGGLSDGDRQFVVTARAVAAAHARAVSTAAPDRATGGDASVDNLAARAASAADDRARDALRAVSSEVAQVLASMAAGLDGLVQAREMLA